MLFRSVGRHRHRGRLRNRAVGIGGGDRVGGGLRDRQRQAARAGIKARPRWSDPAYATRIAISQLIGDQWNMETGWGLHVNEISDNEHKIAIVDWEQQTFSLHEEDTFQNTDNKVRGMKNEALFTMDLSSFCEKYALDELLTN